MNLVYITTNVNERNNYNAIEKKNGNFKLLNETANYFCLEFGLLNKYDFVYYETF